jgi:hypothetical protein
MSALKFALACAWQIPRSENIPLAIARVGLLFVEKREPAKLGRRSLSANVDPASNILGSFIMLIELK